MRIPLGGIFAAGLNCCLLAICPPALAQAYEGDAIFADSFTGNDEFPIALPNSTDSFDTGFGSGVTYEDRRGEVSEWQFSQGRGVVKREVWTEDTGSKGLLSIGFGF